MPNFLFSKTCFSIWVFLLLSCAGLSCAQDAVLSATQTFTGQNTFSAQVLISSNLQVQNGFVVQPSTSPVTVGPTAPGIEVINPQSVLSIGGSELSFANLTTVSSMNVAAENFPLVPLSNGTILKAGGQNSTGDLSTAEIFSPQTGTWSITGSLPASQALAPGVAFQNGNAGIFGGESSVCNSTNTTAIYSSTAGVWTVGPSPPLPYVAEALSLTLLQNGDALIAGGYRIDNTEGICIFGNSGYSNTYLYNPNSNSISSTGSLNTARGGHSAILLNSGSVLAVGGRTIQDGALGVVTDEVFASAEIYSPNSASWVSTGSLNTARYNAMMVLLPNGNPMIFGGYNSDDTAIASAEVFYSTAGAWSNVTAMNSAREGSYYALMPNGNILVAGGIDQNGNLLSSSEIFNANLDTWTYVGSLSTTSAYGGVAILPSGEVLAAGGVENSSIVISTTQVYNPLLNSWSGLSSNFGIVVATDQFVGIGTIVPQENLDVSGGAQFGSGTAKSTFTAIGDLELVSGSTITTAGSLAISTATATSLTGVPAIFVNTGGAVGISTDAPVGLFTVSNDYLIVQNNGNISIGTTAAGAGLNVAGTSNFSSSATFNSSVGFLSITSSLTVQNSEILLGTSSTAGVYSMLVNPSGAVTFVSSVTFLTPIHNSTSAAVICGGANCTGTNTTFSSCVAGSTVTLAMGPNPARLTFTGDGEGTSNETYMVLNFEVDGKFLSPFSNTVGISGVGASNSGSLAFSYVTPPLSAGSHSFCIAAKAGSSSGWILLNNSDQSITFTVEEVK